MSIIVSFSATPAVHGKPVPERREGKVLAWLGNKDQGFSAVVYVPEKKHITVVDIRELAFVREEP